MDRTIRDDSRGLRDIARRARTRAIWTSCGRAERRGAQCAADAPVPGHFGLAVQDYTHAKRLLKAALAGEPAPYGPDALAALAAHCTTQEDNAAKVERRVRKSAAALLLSGRIGQRFAGIVTGAADKGTWVRIAAPMAEGRLILIRGYGGVGVGDRLQVMLVHTEVERGFIDFERVQ